MLVVLLYSLVFVFSSCLPFIVKGQGKPDYAEIPFTLENNRIIVEAVANGKKGRFVFDTGTTESYLNIKTANLSRCGFTITPYKGQNISVNMYNLPKITFGNIELKTRSWVINRSDYLTKSQNDGFDGILGARVFEGYWCELSFSKGKIILHKEKPGYFTLFSPVKILNKYNADFFIPCIIDGKTFYFDIDTGSPAGLYFPSGLIKIKKSDEYRKIVSASPELKVYYLVKANLISILDETYTEYFVMTNSFYSARDDQAYHDFGVLGIDFLRYYDFLFDYRKLREGKSTGVYYEPNTPLEERNYGIYSFIKNVPEFGVLNTTGFDTTGFTIHRILKDSIAYKIYGLRPCMVITRINGYSITEIPREELFDPSFYLTVDNYTLLENGIERTFPSPFKGNPDAIPPVNRHK
jgi:hypothetical protein